MAVQYYDESLLNKIKRWVKDPNITITSPDETRRLFEAVADKANDRPIELPLITLRRRPEIVINNVNKQPLSFDAYTNEVNTETRKVGSVNAIPITLNYSIDIYTRYEAEALEYVREFIFNIINYPELSVLIPYNGVNLEHRSNLTLDPTIPDNSDIPERLIAGQFTRFTINLEINDAYLFSYKIDNTWSVESDLQVKLQDEN